MDSEQTQTGKSIPHSSLSAGGKRKRQYPDRVGGQWTRRRETVGYVLLALFLGGPWITIAGKQSVLFDIPARQFTILGSTFLPEDFFLLALILLLATLTLFLFSALFGRIWCGWACPQTVFLEGVYRQAERLIEGNFRKQMARDQAFKRGEIPPDYYIVKTAKHSLYVLMSAAFALCFSAYFIGREDALELVFSPSDVHPIGFAVFLILTGFMYFVAGFFRELACTFVCPYARLQAVLLDRRSIVIGYDKTRGEPRGKLKRGQERTMGDCIDCSRCIQVCPTGIDIRNGLQLECINCTACMDACDEVMVHIGKPRGLIRYDSTAVLEGESGQKLLRPRTILYSLLFIALTVLLSLQLGRRTDIKAEVLRAQGMPYIKQNDGRIRNAYILKLGNRTNVKHKVEIKPDGLPEAEWTIAGNPLTLNPESELRVNVYGVIPAKALHEETTPVRFYIIQDGKESTVLTAEFLGPEE